MGRVRFERKGPIVVLSRRRARAEHMRALLEAERFEVLPAVAPDAAESLVSQRAPTVVVLDWDFDDEPARDELIHRLRPRRTGVRLVVVAPRADHAVLEAMAAVRAVVDGTLGAEAFAEAFIDGVWGAHNASVDARASRKR